MLKIVFTNGLPVDPAGEIPVTSGIMKVYLGSRVGFGELMSRQLKV